MKSTKTIVIDVYASPVSSNIIKTFYDMKSFDKWYDANFTLNITADQVAINGMMLLGWDEVDEFIEYISIRNK